jgi:biopolymer transport protein ExbD
MRRFKRRPGDAELDITSFMNLMIILVPVLLLNMVFSHITVLDLKLPDLGSPTQSTPDQPKKEQLEVVIYPDRMQVNYPAGQSLRSVPLKDGQQDFAHLSLVLQEVKRLLADQGVQKRDIFILSQPNTDYQTIVSAMDTVRSFKTLVAASVVNAELFPEVALGDAPVLPEPSATAPAGVTP